MMTDVSGNIVQSYSYDSYGNILSTGSQSFVQPYADTGREYDPETGFYYYRARYYNPMAGRFISEDPIRLKGGDYNYYRYVGNNPVNKKDQYGLQAGSPPPPNFGMINQTYHDMLQNGATLLDYYLNDRQYSEPVFGLDKGPPPIRCDCIRACPPNTCYLQRADNPTSPCPCVGPVICR